MNSTVLHYIEQNNTLFLMNVFCNVSSLDEVVFKHRDIVDFTKSDAGSVSDD